MINFRGLMVFLVLVCHFSIQAYAAPLQNKAYRTFWHPVYLGHRLNYCSLDGRECGKTLANRFCQILGFEYSSQSIIAHNVGLTNFLGTKERCVGWTCNGFMSITCATKLSHVPPKAYHYRMKRFVHPRYNHFRVDWCYNRDEGCGARAANSFCSRLGFLQAKHFVKETRANATKTIGSQELCFGPQCNAFETITCYR